MFNFLRRTHRVVPVVQQIDVSTRSDVGLGDLAREKVTGFSGVVTSMSYEMDGSIFVGLQPSTVENGKPADAFDFDIERIEVIESKHVIVNTSIETQKTVKIGAKYRDRVSGFEGICVGRVDFLGGCTRLSLRGRVDKDNKLPEPMLLAVERAELVDDTPVKEAAERATKTGGPGKTDLALVRGILAR